MQKLPILLIPEKTDIERERVVQTWLSKGGRVRRLGKYWLKDEQLATEPLAVYGNQTFSLVLAQVYNLSLQSPDDQLIASLDKKWTERSIQLKQISELRDADFPVFIKPVIPKLFAAGVFHSFDAFKKETSGLTEHEELLVSEVVGIKAEARSYVLGSTVKDMAVYEGEADIEEGRRFLNDFVQQHQNLLPKTVVVDLAYNSQSGWFILEFNACWGAGLNGCSAENVIDCIIQATALAEE